jgi:tubulin-specific chaperone D
LPNWLPVLAEAFLEYQQGRPRHAAEASSTSSLLMPLPTAVCKLIYTFCKIRGEKVVVNFLNVETRYLELLLSAIEESERHLGSEGAVLHWTWEERYVVLLWLSHLMFAPFDLATISSVYMHDVDLAGVPGFLWPFNPPSITVRILPLATKYLSSPGRERDAAKTLLVRMAMRRDMQKLGILQALIDWALFSLHPSQEDSDPAGNRGSKNEHNQNPYTFIGVLSFLAGVLSSADASEVERYSSKVFYTVNATMWSDDDTSNIINSSAVAKKTVIKVMRSISLSKLTRESRDMAGIQLVETTVRYLLRSLSDKDTPVRFAASKALGAITLKLPKEMASQVVAAVLQALREHVRVSNQAPDSVLSSSQPLKKDLSSVDPLEWHGLMLTLSHLLYRRSPPPDSLGDILQALLHGLSFEQRSATGVSVGANVRDAACFGVWAVARRYSTDELLAVNHDLLKGEQRETSRSSVLQLLATHLVVTACLDPAGNIRRGSSAALQELIGRHPDTVENGIAIVQTVDYHAVALRSRAMQDVALAATKLHSQYGDAILEAVIGWRGLGDSNDRIRRYAGVSYGMITAELARMSAASSEVIFRSVDDIASSLRVLQARQVEERHGLLLAMASVMDQLPQIVSSCQNDRQQLALVIERMLSEVEWNLRSIETTASRRPDLIAEAASRLFTSSLPVFQASYLGVHATMPEDLVPAPSLSSFLKTSSTSTAVSRLAVLSDSGEFPRAWVNELLPGILNNFLVRTEQAVADAASEAAVALLFFMDSPQRHELIENWANIVLNAPRGGSIKGHLMALTRSHAVVRMSLRETKNASLDIIPKTLLQCWAKDMTVDTRVWILESLVEGDVLRYNAQNLLQLLAEALEDYTTDARGDVGSHARLHAIQATKHLWSLMAVPGTMTSDASHAAASSLLLPTIRLCSEKLDKLRPEAQSTLSLALCAEYATPPLSLLGNEIINTGHSASKELMKRSCSSPDYFYFLLDLITHQDWLHEVFRVENGPKPDEWMDELLAGYVTSADTGNEDLVIASRSALCEYCAASQENLDRVCTSLYRNMKARQGQDRVIVPTLEMIAFLLSVGLYQITNTVDFKNLCLQAQKASYKTGNVRKLLACVKMYGGIASMGTGGEGLTPMATDALEQKRQEAVAEARRRLGALLLHPWPRVRTAVVDELWNVLSGHEDEMAARLKGVDWGAAEKGMLKQFGVDLSL